MAVEIATREHSPTPWAISRNLPPITWGKHRTVTVETRDTLLSITEPADKGTSDAEFIVRAVNAHDALASAARMAAAALAFVDSTCGDAHNGVRCQECVGCLKAEAIAQTTAALARLS